MKKLDIFILKAFIGPFIAILLVVVFVLMLHTLWLYIDELVGKGLGLGVILEFLWWGICIILPLALPLATLLSSMMVVGQMGENNELFAIKASGVSLARVMAPLMGMSLLISIGAFFVGNNLVPLAYNEMFTLRDDILHTKNEIRIPSGTFYEGIEGYVLRVQRQDKKTGVLHDVMVYDHTGHKGNTNVTIADSAVLKLSKAKDYLTFSLYNGVNYQEDNSRSYQDTTLGLQRIQFSRQALLIPLQNYSFEKSDSSRFGDQVKAKSLVMLTADKDTLDKRRREAFDKHYRQLCRGGLFTQQAQLDTSRRAPDARPFENAHMWAWKELDQVISAYSEAASSAGRACSEVMSMSHDVYETTFYSRRTDIELFKKFAQALACFIFFFIGAPLGALIRRGGLGISAIVSVLFFVLYWVVDISGTKLATDGAVSPLRGVFVSTAVLAPIGMFLSWKAVHDSELLNMDAFKLWRKRIWRRFGGIFRKTRIVYMGTPEFAVAPLEALLSKGYNVVGVVTVADKPSGRGQRINESAVKQYAVAHGIPVLQPLKLKDPAFLDALRAWKADLFVVVAFRMLPEEVWRMPHLGTFNLHAALLPQYRGAAPINWAVINGERISGVTTFMIDKDIDTGGIILRQECRIGPDETAGELHDKLMPVGAELVVQTVQGILDDNVELRVQRSFVQGAEVLRTAPKLTRELCHIDWNDGTERIRNLIRGLSPCPAAFTTLVSETGESVKLKVFAACNAPEWHGKPGEVFSDGKTFLAIATADGALKLLDVQLEGKKRMDVASFLRGWRYAGGWQAGAGTSKRCLDEVVSA